MKRTVQVNVKMSLEDFSLLKKSCPETLAQCGDDQFRNCAGAGKDCREGDPQF